MTNIMRTRKIGNHPRMSYRVMEALLKLREAYQADAPFVPLDGFHGRTIKTMLEHDWAFESDGLDGVRYKITGRGLKILKIYDTPPKRKLDGMCPQCGTRPKAFSKSGRSLGYCRDCYRENARRSYKLIGIQMDPDSKCGDCRNNPRITNANGHIISSYCADCKKKRDRERYWRRRAEYWYARAHRAEAELAALHSEAQTA